MYLKEVFDYKVENNIKILKFNKTENCILLQTVDQIGQNDYILFGKLGKDLLMPAQLLFLKEIKEMIRWVSDTEQYTEEMYKVLQAFCTKNQFILTQEGFEIMIGKPKFLGNRMKRTMAIDFDGTPYNCYYMMEYMTETEEVKVAPKSFEPLSNYSPIELTQYDQENLDLSGYIKYQMLFFKELLKKRTDGAILLMKYRDAVGKQDAEYLERVEMDIVHLIEASIRKEWGTSHTR